MTRRHITIREQRRYAERAAAELEARVRHLQEQRRPVPHTLMAALLRARTIALAVGPVRRIAA